jgi:hypothetical protein
LPFYRQDYYTLALEEAFCGSLEKEKNSRITVAQKTVVYKGYHGTIKVNTGDYSLYGTILFIDEEIAYHGQTFEELDANFRLAVEKHIAGCRAKGQEPPFSDP